MAWVEKACALGVGEILLNSMDADGTRAGYDIGMITAVRAVSKVPLIASGGADKLLRVYNIKNRCLKVTLKYDKHHLSALSFKKNNKFNCEYKSR